MNTDGFLCPYCLSTEASPVLMGQNRRNYFACRECEARIPAEYIETASVPKEVVAAVGFRGHGKSVYLAALYYELNELARFWSGFYTFPMDERSLDTVNENIRLLRAGELPAATPASFPVPTIVRLSNMPCWGEGVFLFYDVGGEAFTRAESMIRDASFVRRAQTVSFFMSLDEFGFDPMKMYGLLSIYVQGITELGGDARQQNLVVILSKGDRLKLRLANYLHVWEYLTSGALDRCTEMEAYVERMKAISESLSEFLTELGGVQFLNFARSRFRSVEFSLVSALGAQPSDGRLQVKVNPKRVIDPLIWTMVKSVRYGEKPVTEEKKYEWFQIFHRRHKKGAAGGNRPAE